MTGSICRMRFVLLCTHVLAVTVWVGGQLTIAVLMPSLRGAGSDVSEGRRIVSVAARRFQPLAWGAFVLLLFSGLGLLMDSSRGGSFGQVFAEKMVFVAVSAIAAGVHALGTGPRVRKSAGSDPTRARRLAVGGRVLSSVGLVAAVVATGYGIYLVT